MSYSYRSGEYMRVATLAVALAAIITGVVGIVAPDSLRMAAR